MLGSAQVARNGNSHLVEVEINRGNGLSRKSRRWTIANIRGRLLKVVEEIEHIHIPVSVCSKTICQYEKIRKEITTYQISQMNRSNSGNERRSGEDSL